MNPRNLPGGQPRRRCRPGVEALEGRELLSPGPIVAPPIKAHVDPKLIPTFINTLYPPGNPLGQPSPAEVKRESFIGKWVGTYVVGPGRFADQASTIEISSKDGGANQFHKGRIHLMMFTPAPEAAQIASQGTYDPTAGQYTGLAALYPQSYLQNIALLQIDIGGLPNVSNTQPPPLPYSAFPVNLGETPTIRGMPTRLPWTIDTTSAGTYTTPVNFTQGTGVIDFKYIPDPHPRPGTMGSGQVIITVQGLVNTAGDLSGDNKNFM